MIPVHMEYRDLRRGSWAVCTMNVMKNLTDDLKKVTCPKCLKWLEPYELRDPMTLEEIAQEMGLTRERIRQIEAKALRKLRHPTRSKNLSVYYYDDDSTLPHGWQWRGRRDRCPPAPRQRSKSMSSPAATTRRPSRGVPAARGRTSARPRRGGCAFRRCRPSRRRWNYVVSRSGR